MVVAEQVKVGINNHNCFISMKADTNNKRLFKTIYEAVDQYYFKESRKFTNYFIRMCKTNPNEP